MSKPHNDRLEHLVISTPEGCSFSLLLAGPVVRFWAWFVDLIVVIGLVILTSQLLSFFNVLIPDITMAVNILAFFLIWFGYGILLEGIWNGQTLGKRIFHLRVMDEQGLKLGVYQVFIRNLLRLVDSLPNFYLLGGVICLLTRRCQRLGDLAAGTVVVKTIRPDIPDVERILGDKYNSFRKYPQLEARLRQQVSPSEAQVLLQALLRRNSLKPTARVDLYRELAEHFRKLVDFPQAATDGLSDEHYLRNVVESLFRPRMRNKSP